jgi:hypothetical protein
VRSTTAIMMAGLAVLVVAGSVKAETITNETFTSNTDFDAAAPSDWFVETNATWTISPGVTVTVGTGDIRPRFFVDSNATPNGNGRWTITGGGTVSQDITGYAACRLGHSGGTHGTVIIEGGSTYRITNWGPFFASFAGSGALEINGVGSTFSAKGAYTPITETNGTFLAASNCVAGVNDVLVSFSGGSPLVTDLGGGFTQLSVPPPPPPAGTVISIR